MMSIVHRGPEMKAVVNTVVKAFVKYGSIQPWRVASMLETLHRDWERISSGDLHIDHDLIALGDPTLQRMSHEDQTEDRDGKK